MAQFQILTSYTASDWRPVTVDFHYAPHGDEQHLWPSFEEAETVRRTLIARSPDMVLRVALAGADNDDIDWQSRENLRFADGTYAPTPWHHEPWYQALHGEHFCHVSTEQAGKIAFTENDMKGRADRQLVMSPGRYLHRFFSGHLDNNDVESWCAKLSVLLQEHALKITQDPDEIEDIYVGGPSSCMSHDASDYESSCHPTRVYAGPDTAIAYIGARNDATARSVVWPARRIYTSIYGDVSRLRLLLEEAGYAEGRLSGARIRRICDGDDFVVPYIDTGSDLYDDGEYLIVGRGSIPSENTNGLSRTPWYCPRCDDSAIAYAAVYDRHGGSEDWCSDCVHNDTTRCAHDGRLYSDDETFITVWSDHGSHEVLDDNVEDFGAVYLEDRHEWWAGRCCRRCDATGDWFHAGDLTEYQGEWLCDGHLPEPFDDDDPDLVNAHILARRHALAGRDDIAREAFASSLGDLADPSFLPVSETAFLAIATTPPVNGDAQARMGA